MTTREEHLAWCKTRALEYCERGDTRNALASMFSDLNKHPETREHIGCKMGVMLMMKGHLKSVPDAKAFIEGIN